MTIKVNEIVIDALEYLIVQADEQKIPQSEAKAAIRTLNDLMSKWDAQGISLGFSEVSDMGDIMTVPIGAKMGIKTNLALALAPKYNVAPDAGLVMLARDGYRALLTLAVDTAPMEYPAELPMGTGNTAPDTTDDLFYPDETDTILTETGGSIGLEEDTEEA